MWPLPGTGYQLSESEVLAGVSLARRRVQMLNDRLRQHPPAAPGDTASEVGVMRRWRDAILEASEGLNATVFDLSLTRRLTVAEQRVRARLTALSGRSAPENIAALVAEGGARTEVGNAHEGYVAQVREKGPEAVAALVGPAFECLAEVADMKPFTIDDPTRVVESRDLPFGERLPFDSVGVLLPAALPVAPALTASQSEVEQLYGKAGIHVESEGWIDGIVLVADDDQQIARRAYLMGRLGIRERAGREASNESFSYSIWATDLNEIDLAHPDLPQIVHNARQLLYQGKWVAGITDPEYREPAGARAPRTGENRGDGLIGRISYNIRHASSRSAWQQAEAVERNYEVGNHWKRYWIKNREVHVTEGIPRTRDFEPESRPLTPEELEFGYHREWRPVRGWVVGDLEKAAAKRPVRALGLPEDVIRPSTNAGVSGGL